MDLPSIKSPVDAFLSGIDIAEERKTLARQRYNDEHGVTEPQAYAYLLVELGLCDGRFELKERQIVEHFLVEQFQVSPSEAQQCVNTAQSLLPFFGKNSCLAAVKANSTERDVEKLFEIVDRVIAADGIEDPHESYLRMRLRDLLGDSAQSKPSI